MDLIETIINKDRITPWNDVFELFDVNSSGISSSVISELGKKIKSEDFIKKEVIKIVGENNIEVYLNNIAEIFKDYASILAQYNLPIIMGLRNMGKDNDYINNSLFYRIFEYLCEFDDSYKALKNKFDLAIVSRMQDLGNINKELEKEIEKKKSQQEIIDDLIKENMELKSKIQSHEIQNRELKLEISQIEKSKLEEKLEAKKEKKIMADSIWNAYSDIAFKYGNTQNKNKNIYKRGFWGFIKKFFKSLGVNYIVLGLSIVGSLLTFTDWFNGLFIKLGVYNSGKVLLVGNGLDFYKIIMIKIPFAIVGFLAYRNIQRNRLFEEEYNHKKNIMKIYAEFIYDDFVKDEMKAIMLRAVESNPNDKLIKKDKDITEKIIKVTENTVKTALQKEKNSNK